MIQTPSEHGEYRKQIKRALQDQFLGRALHKFAREYPQARAAAFQGMDFRALVQEVARIKADARSHLDELYKQFKETAEAAGVTVHWARDASEANRIIAQVAAKGGVKKIVKSKSMTAEETHLNEHLEAADFQVVETDLGEWIIQLRHEGPSHMVIPAIHLSRDKIAELFNRTTGSHLDPDDIDGMVKVARKELRQHFLTADMGISGANFALADTATIGLVTNEGNARLVTTLPRIHLALVGVDKLLPSMAEALAIMEVLPRNTVGQHISSYVTWISGANACAVGPGGRKEMHVVFLDNGRTALAADPVFGQALACVRCGACANVCPIYKQIGGHNYGHVYVGAIGLILTYFYHGRLNDRALVKNCLNCQACKEICSAGIDLPALIKKTQGLIQAEEGPPPKNRVMAAVMRDRRLFHFLLRRARLAQKPLARGDRLIRHLPSYFAEHNFRSLPVIAARPLRDRWTAIRPRPDKPKLKGALFAGCLVDFVYPEMGEDLCRVLEGRGVRLAFPRGQTCCGLPAAMASEEGLAMDVAADNLAALDPAAHDFVLTLCASCASFLKNEYPRLMAGRSGLEVKARQLAAKVIDFSSFMTDVLGVEPPAGAGGETAGVKAAYHAPCHLCRGLGVHRSPRELIAAAGLEYVPTEEEEVCCGFGGSYSMDFPELSATILGQKLDSVEQSGAQVLVTDCPGCLLQLEGGLDHRGSRVRAVHQVQALAAGLPKSG